MCFLINYFHLNCKILINSIIVMILIAPVVFGGPSYIVKVTLRACKSP